MNTEFNWLSQILYPVLTVIIPILVGWLGYTLKKWADAKYGKDQFERALGYAQTVCSAIEQIAGKYGWDSKTKFDKAMGKVKEWAVTVGIKFTDSQWEMIIEKTVLEFSDLWKTLKGEKAIDIGCVTEPPTTGTDTMPVADLGIPVTTP